jgi:hypothetical protein
MMRAIKLPAETTDDHNVTLRVPDDLPAGPAEVILLVPDDEFAARRERARALQRNPAAWIRAFDAWVRSHDPNLPVLPAEALRQEAMYEDRL